MFIRSRRYSGAASGLGSLVRGWGSIAVGRRNDFGFFELTGLGLDGKLKETEIHGERLIRDYGIAVM